jgi:hypothetical protein
LTSEAGVEGRDESLAHGVVEVAGQALGEVRADGEEAWGEVASVRINEEEPGEAAVAAEDIECPGDGGIGAAKRVALAGRRGLEPVHEQLGGPLEEGAEEGLLAGEVEVESTFGGSGLRGDLFHACITVAAPGEDLECRFEDALAPARSLAGVSGIEGGFG